MLTKTASKLSDQALAKKQKQKNEDAPSDHLHLVLREIYVGQEAELHDASGGSHEHFLSDCYIRSGNDLSARTRDAQIDR